MGPNAAADPNQWNARSPKRALDRRVFPSVRSKFHGVTSVNRAIRKRPARIPNVMAVIRRAGNDGRRRSRILQG